MLFWFGVFFLFFSIFFLFNSTLVEVWSRKLFQRQIFNPGVHFPFPFPLGMWRCICKIRGKDVPPYFVLGVVSFLHWESDLRLPEYYWMDIILQLQCTHSHSPLILPSAGTTQDFEAKLCKVCWELFWRREGVVRNPTCLLSSTQWQGSGQNREWERHWTEK